MNVLNLYSCTIMYIYIIDLSFILRKQYLILGLSEIYDIVILIKHNIIIWLQLIEWM